GRDGAQRAHALDRPGGRPPLDRADRLCRRDARSAARGPAPLRDLRRGDPDRARRVDPRRARARLADRQLLARRRLEGHLGAAGRRGAGARARAGDGLHAAHPARPASGLLDRPSATAAATAPAAGLMLAIMGAAGGADAAGRSSRGETVALLSTAPSNAHSVVASLERACEGARTVRDVISAEMWEAINAAHLVLADAAIGVTGYAGPYSFVSYVKSRTALFWGVASRTMLRDDAYAFLDAGGRFESADMVLRMLRVALPAPGENGASTRDGQALALLGAVGGLQAFRRADVAAPSATAVASF